MVLISLANNDLSFNANRKLRYLLVLAFSIASRYTQLAAIKPVFLYRPQLSAMLRLHYPKS